MILVFDMDGVLVDVSESYRQTIQDTVSHFTGREITRAAIQDYKNQGGWNDDWALSHHIIGELGAQVPYESVVEYFQSIFHGDGTNGLILRERWIADDGLFTRLAARFQLAVFTGRLQWEAELTLRRFAPEIRFAPIAAVDTVTRPKPAPDGLLQIAAATGQNQMWYVGDTVDDARSAKAAGVPFIGIAEPSKPRHEELCALLNAEGAIAVLENINSLESVLPL